MPKKNETKLTPLQWLVDKELLLHLKLGSTSLTSLECSSYSPIDPSIKGRETTEILDSEKKTYPAFLHDSSRSGKKQKDGCLKSGSFLF